MRIGKVMISKVIPLEKPGTSVSINLMLTFIELLCLSTLNANPFSLKTKYFEVAK